MGQLEINLRDLFRVVRKRKWIIIVAPILMGIATYAFTEPPRPVYNAETLLRITRTTTVAGLMTDLVSYTAYDNMATQIMVISSQPVLEQVAIRLKMIRRDEDPTSAVNVLKGSISAEQRASSDILAIKAKASTQEESTDRANTTAEIYIARNGEERDQRILASIQFLQKRLSDTTQQLLDAEQGLGNFQRANAGALAAGGMLGSQSQEKELGLKQRLQDTRNALATVLRIQESKNYESFLHSYFPVEDPGLRALVEEVDRRLAALGDLTGKRAQLLSVQTEIAPQVKTLNGQISAEEARLDAYLATLLRRLRAQESDFDNLLQTLWRERQDALRGPELQSRLVNLQNLVKEKQDLVSLLRKQVNDAEIRQREKVEEINIVERAKAASVEPQTSVLYKALIGALIGILIGGVFAFVLESMDTSIGTIEDVERYINSVVLGIIPHIETEDVKSRMKLDQFPAHVTADDINRFSRLTAHFDSKSVPSESYRTLRTNVSSIMARTSKKCFLVTSSVIQEGKTTSSANLAVAFAQTGQKTLLLDMDLRRPIIDKIFGMEKTPGLSDLLLGTRSLKECVRGIDDFILGKYGLKATQATPGLEYLSIVPAGTSVDNPTELISSPAMDRLLETCRNNFDVVILDVSPILPVADAFVLASKVDGVILAYQIGRVAREVLKRSKLRVESVGGTVWGIIMNDIQAEIDYKQGDFQYYHYEYRSGTQKLNPGWMDRLRDRFASARPPRPAAGKSRDRILDIPVPKVPASAGKSGESSRDQEMRDIMSLTDDK